MKHRKHMELGNFREKQIISDQDQMDDIVCAFASSFCRRFAAACFSCFMYFGSILVFLENELRSAKETMNLCKNVVRFYLA